MGVYLVEIKVEVLVGADDAAAAETIAEMNCREILDNEDPEISCMMQVKSLASLPGGFNHSDYAYDAHGNDQPLFKLLPDEDPFVDTKTIDMFAGAQP